jgi:hypothetical protein
MGRCSAPFNIGSEYENTEIMGALHSFLLIQELFWGQLEKDFLFSFFLCSCLLLVKKVALMLISNNVIKY